MRFCSRCELAGVESRSTNSGVLESLRLSQRFRVVAQSGYSARSVGCLIFSASSWLSFRFHLDHFLLGNQSTLRSDYPGCCRGAGRNRVLDAVQRRAHLPASESKAGAEGPGSHPRSCEKTFCRFTLSSAIRCMLRPHFIVCTLRGLFGESYFAQLQKETRVPLYGAW